MLELTRACGESVELSLGAAGVEVFVVELFVWVPVPGTGTDIFALMMCTSAFGWFALNSD